MARMAPSHPLALSCLWFHLGILLLLIYVLLCWEITTASAHTQQNKAIHHHESLVFPQLDNGLPATKPLEIGTANLEVLVFQTSRSISCLLTKVAQLPDSLQPPARTVVAAPAVTGTYPVILFKHGFAIQNCYYTDMFTLLASSGYIIVAPQHTTLDSDCTAEIEETRNVAIWIHGSLQEVLLNAMPKVKVTPNTSSLIMAGHSRGGKVAFAMALGKGSSDANDDVNFSALVALDPVDGFSLSTSSVPQMVKADCTHNLNRLLIPALILGTGYGEKGLVPCAPSCCSHQGYFNCSSSPLMYHLSAVEYGHMDFLDQTTMITDVVCESQHLVRKQLHLFTARLVLAFLRATLEGYFGDINYIIDNWDKNIDSVELNQPEFYESGDFTLKTCAWELHPSPSLKSST